MWEGVLHPSGLRKTRVWAHSATGGDWPFWQAPPTPSLAGRKGTLLLVRGGLTTSPGSDSLHYGGKVLPLGDPVGTSTRCSCPLTLQVFLPPSLSGPIQRDIEGEAVGTLQLLVLHKISIAETGKTTVVTVRGIQAVATIHAYICTVATNLASPGGQVMLKWKIH